MFYQNDYFKGAFFCNDFFKNDFFKKPYFTGIGDGCLPDTATNPPPPPDNGDCKPKKKGKNAK